MKKELSGNFIKFRHDEVICLKLQYSVTSVFVNGRSVAVDLSSSKVFHLLSVFDMLRDQLHMVFYLIPAAIQGGNICVVTYISRLTSA